MASVEELWLHWSRPLHSSRLADLARRSALSRGCPMALDAASALSPGYHAERPLLPRGAPAVCGEPPEELDAKYARRYPYGVICRGSRSWLSCFCCSALLLRGPRARVRRLAEWRRRVVLRPCCALSPAVLFIFCFYRLLYIWFNHRNPEESVVSAINLKGISCSYCYFAGGLN